MLHAQTTDTVDQASREKEVRAEATRRIKALGRAGKPKEAVGELAQMARLGVQPDTQSATALIDACMRSGKVEMAESVFEELFTALLAPDEVTFSVLLRGYGDQQPPRWTAISNTLNTMERTYGLAPSTVTFNTLLEVCSRTRDEARGAEIIERMEVAGVRPNEFTLDAVRQRKSLRSLLKRTFGL
jgi:pentatricopeptide repeat protein